MMGFEQSITSLASDRMRLDIQRVKYDPEYRRLCEEIGRLMHQADPAKWEQLAQDIGREK